MSNNTFADHDQSFNWDNAAQIVKDSRFPISPCAPSRGPSPRDEAS